MEGNIDEANCSLETWREIEDLLDDAGDYFASHHRTGSSIDKELLMCLGAVFGPETLESALDLIDQRLVTQVRLANASVPSLYKVRGSSGASYTILWPPVNRCSCPAWSLSTWRAGTEGTTKEHVRIPRTSCKHVLAAALSNSICRHLTTDEEREKVVKVLSVTEETYLEMISSMD